MNNVLAPRLAQYARELLAAGFRVYLPASAVKRVDNGGLPQVCKWLQFSREVDGQTCYATVSLGYFDAAEFSMPIPPTRENGSSMWIGSRRSPMGSSEALDLTNARRYAVKTAYNPLVGTQRNFTDPTWQAKLYIEAAAEDLA